jgi:HEAT repeat protein
VIDDIDWAALEHAEGCADDLPGLLRDAEFDTIVDLVFRQGTLYSATVAAVPFLAGLAHRAPARRDEFSWLLGMLADRNHAYGELFDEIRAAVAAQPLPPLDDPDPRVRAAAAYVVAQLDGPVTLLHDRFAIETDPAVRSSLLLALGELDPAGAAARFPFTGSADERYAAGLAAVRAGVPLPAGAPAAVTAALDDGVDLNYAWLQREPVDELLLSATDEGAADLIDALILSPEPATRRAAVFAVAERSMRHRSAPADLVPKIARLLEDPDSGVRDEVISTLRSTGSIAGRYRDHLAAVATDHAATAGRPGITPAQQAWETLQRLGDPRWVELAATVRIREPRWVPYAPEVVDAVRRHLPNCHHLVDLLGLWGPQAVAAVPDLVALLPQAGALAARALARIGYTSFEALPHLGPLAADGDLDAAAAIRQLTGDPQPLLTALAAWFDPPPPPAVGFGLTALLETRHAPRRDPWMITRLPLLNSGSDLMPVVPAARSYLTGVCRASYAERARQILAALVVVAATDETAEVLPTLRSLIIRDFYGVADTAELLADLVGPDDELLRRLDLLLAGERIIRGGSAVDFIWIDEAISVRLQAVRDRLRPALPAVSP